jgi:hypothetical protein
LSFEEVLGFTKRFEVAVLILSFLRNLLIRLTFLFAYSRTSTSMTRSKQFEPAALNATGSMLTVNKCQWKIVSKKAQRIIPSTTNDWELLIELEWSFEEKKLTKLVSFPTNKLCTTSLHQRIYSNLLYIFRTLSNLKTNNLQPRRKHSIIQTLIKFYKILRIVF